MESDGWFVVPSKLNSAVDLIAIDPENGHTLMLTFQSFIGDVYYTSKTKRAREQQVKMCRLESMFNGNCSVFYALRKKGQSDFHFIHPHKLSKPYHWNQEGT